MPTVIALADLPRFAGKEIGTSQWLEMDQDRIDRFAEATADYQWIHVDTDRAASGPFGTTIAHGFLTPVRPGDKIRSRLEILRVEDFKGGVKVENRSTVEIDGAERPACIVEGIAVHYPA